MMKKIITSISFFALTLEAMDCPKLRSNQLPKEISTIHWLIYLTTEGEKKATLLREFALRSPYIKNLLESDPQCGTKETPLNLPVSLEQVGLLRTILELQRRLDRDLEFDCLEHLSLEKLVECAEAADVLNYDSLLPRLLPVLARKIHEQADLFLFEKESMSQLIQDTLKSRLAHFVLTEQDKEFLKCNIFTKLKVDSPSRIRTICHMNFNDCDNYLATCGSNFADIFDTSTGEKVIGLPVDQFQGEKIEDGFFICTPQYVFFVTRSAATIRVWDLVSRVCIPAGLPVDMGNILGMCVSKDCSLVAFALPSQIGIWNVKNRGWISLTLENNKSVLPHRIQISPDNKFLVESRWGSGVRLWDLQVVLENNSSSRAQGIPVSPENVNEFQLNNKGTILSFFSKCSGLIGRMDLEQKKLLDENKFDEYTMDKNSIGPWFNADGTMLALQSKKGGGAVYHLDKKKEVSLVLSGLIQNACFHPNDLTVVIARRENVLVYDTLTGQQLAILDSGDSECKCILFSNKGLLFATVNTVDRNGGMVKLCHYFNCKISDYLANVGFDEALFLHVLCEKAREQGEQLNSPLPISKDSHVKALYDAFPKEFKDYLSTLVTMVEASSQAQSSLPAATPASKINP